MQAFLNCCGVSASPFTRVGSQVQSLPRPPWLTRHDRTDYFPALIF